MQVGSLASAAAELKALNIGVTLQALQVDTKADAQELMNGWLAILETSRPPLSEHRSHLLAALYGAKGPSCLQSWYLFFGEIGCDGASYECFLHLAPCHHLVADADMVTMS